MDRELLSASWLTRCSFVGNRQDAIESLDFAARGLVKSHYITEPLANLESVYERITQGSLPGRVVLECCK